MLGLINLIGNSEPENDLRTLATEVLQQYKALNMDALNGKNFTYELLKAEHIQ